MMMSIKVCLFEYVFANSPFLTFLAMVGVYRLCAQNVWLASCKPV